MDENDPVPPGEGCTSFTQTDVARDPSQLDTVRRMLGKAPLKPTPEHLAYLKAVERNQQDKRRARQIILPMTIHRFGPMHQTEFSKAIDAALFDNLKMQMNGCQWPNQSTMTLSDFLKPTSGRWLWLTCRNCTHRVATPIAPLAIRLGFRYPISRLREKAWCSVCGLFGADTMAKGWENAEIGEEPFPPTRGYAHHFAELQAAGELRYAIGARTSNAPLVEGLTLAQAIAGALLASGYSLRGGEGRSSVGLAILEGRTHLVGFDASMLSQDRASAWRQVHTAIRQDLKLMERFYVIDNGAVI